ncbi:hypothetical protein ERO13_A01G219050v2 [Gossypium hirsutum]|nr:hypothetical protein ERO13_A01G219050v2 [Gossypium hirsutum]
MLIVKLIQLGDNNGCCRPSCPCKAKGKMTQTTSPQHQLPQEEIKQSKLQQSCITQLSEK